MCGWWSYGPLLVYRVHRVVGSTHITRRSYAGGGVCSDALWPCRGPACLPERLDKHARDALAKKLVSYAQNVWGSQWAAMDDHRAVNLGKCPLTERQTIELLVVRGRSARPRKPSSRRCGPVSFRSRVGFLASRGSVWHLHSALATHPTAGSGAHSAVCVSRARVVAGARTVIQHHNLHRRRQAARGVRAWRRGVRHHACALP